LILVTAAAVVGLQNLFEFLMLIAVLVAGLALGKKIRRDVQTRRSLEAAESLQELQPGGDPAGGESGELPTQDVGDQHQARRRPPRRLRNDREDPWLNDVEEDWG
jgi:hypothetical protein